MQNLLKNCDACLVSSDINRRYFTDFASSAGMVLITREKSYFLTDFRYYTDAKNQIKNYETIMVSANKGYFANINELIKEHSINSLGVEFDSLTVNEFKRYESNFAVNFCDISSEIMSLRNVKTELELQKMIASQKIIDEVFEKICIFIKENYKNGLTEKQIAAKIVALIYELGCENISFDPIVASGKNGASPHAKPTDKKVQAGEFITMDFGGILNGYCSDMTRTIAVGHATEEMRKIYNLVLSAQLEGIKIAKSGISGAEIHNTANEIFAKENMDKYFGHGFGHGLGLEVHEGLSASPSCTEILPENMVISAEPGLYIEDFGGVRIEDILILKPNGSINITKSPKELIIL